jgi:hypothetical protein
MTSEPTAAFVWIWLPGAADPVVCGRIDADRTPVTFTSGRRYLDRSDAVPIYEPELPRPDESRGCIAVRRDSTVTGGPMRVEPSTYWSGRASTRGFYLAQLTQVGVAGRASSRSAAILSPQTVQIP